MSNTFYDEKLKCNYVMLTERPKLELDYRYKFYNFYLEMPEPNGKLYEVEGLMCCHSKETTIPLFKYKARFFNTKKSFTIGTSHFCITAKEMVSMINLNIEKAFPNITDENPRDLFSVKIDPIDLTISYSIKRNKINEKMYNYIISCYGDITVLDTYKLTSDLLTGLSRPYVPIDSGVICVNYETDHGLDNTTLPLLTGEKKSIEVIRGGGKENITTNGLPFNEAVYYSELSDEDKEYVFFIDPINLKGNNYIRYVNMKNRAQTDDFSVVLDRFKYYNFFKEEGDIWLNQCYNTDRFIKLAAWKIMPNKDYYQISEKELLDNNKLFEDRCISKIVKDLFGKVDKELYRLEYNEFILTLYIDINSVKSDIKDYKYDKHALYVRPYRLSTVYKHFYSFIYDLNVKVDKFKFA